LVKISKYVESGVCTFELHVQAVSTWLSDTLYRAMWIHDTVTHMWVFMYHVISLEKRHG